MHIVLCISLLFNILIILTILLLILFRKKIFEYVSHKFIEEQFSNIDRNINDILNMLNK